MPYIADPSQLGRYRRGDGLDALTRAQLAVAGRQDKHHCAVCGCHIGWWFYGFPFPLCASCKDRDGVLPEWLWKRAGVIFAQVPERLRCPPPRRRPCTECGPCPGGGCYEFGHRWAPALRQWKEARHGAG